MSDVVFAWTNRPHKGTLRIHRAVQPMTVVYPGLRQTPGLRVSCQLVALKEPYTAYRSPLMLPDEGEPCWSCWTLSLWEQAVYVLGKEDG